MREPRWKRWLSYLTEIHIESAASAHNPHLYVSLRRGRYQLSAAHAVYSYADLYSNFDRAFQRLRMEQLPGTEVLLLGFGMGSIPVLLEKKWKRHYAYTAVEVDEVVLELATRYVLPDLHSPIDLVCADASIFVAVAQERFDLICMDIFLDDQIPEVFESFDFLEDLRERLHADACLLYNRLTATAADQHATKHFYESVFLKVFPEGGFLPVGGNWILVNDKRYIIGD